MAKNQLRGSKRQILEADHETELAGLKAFYTKVAGANPALNVNADPTEAELWAAIAAVAKPFLDAQGLNNVTTGAYSTPLGEACETVGRASLAYGFKAKARNDYQVAQGKAFSVPGDGQYTHQVVIGTSTGDIPTKMEIKTLPMAVNGIYSITMEIFGCSADASAYGLYTYRSIMKRTAGALSLVVPTQYLNTNLVSTPAPAGVTMTPDPSNESMNLYCSGLSGKTIRWIVVAKALEIVF